MIGTKKQKTSTSKKELPFNPAKPFLAELERLGFEVDTDAETEFKVYGPEEKYDHDYNLIPQLYSDDAGFEFSFEVGNDFEYCCGAKEFGSFRYEGPDEFELPATRYVLTNFISNYKNTGMLIATHYTNHAVSTVLREFGLHEQTFTNPNTGSKLSMFSHVVTTKRSKRR